MQSPQRWPLAASIGTRDATLTRDARMINCYAEKDPNTGEANVIKRFGTLLYSSTGFQQPSPLSTGYGLYAWDLSSPGGYNINLYSVSGTSLYKNGTFVGTLTSGGTTVNNMMFWQSMLKSSPNPLLVFSAGGANNCATYYTNGSSVSVISDPNFPVNTVPGFAYLDGTLYVMDVNGVIWNSSNFDDPTVWSALGNIPARVDTDKGVLCFRHLQFVIALKRWTMEAFYDAGQPLPGSPLLEVPSAFNNFGCIDSNTWAEIDGINFWVSSNRALSPQVIMLQNLQPSIVSDPRVERLLTIANLPTLTYGYRAFTIKHAGHRFYCLTVFSLGLTLVLDIDLGMWYVWSGTYAGSPTTVTGLNPWNIGSATYNQFFNKHIGQDAFTGQIYGIDTCYVYPTDNGVILPVDIYTQSTDFGTRRRKVLHRMYFRADQASTGYLYCRYTDDDYSNWSNMRQVNMRSKAPYINNEGTFVKRAYHFRYADATPLRLNSADLQMDIGTI